MITFLAVRNFKRFRRADFELRPLTVFTGLNGTGKSTAIQALLLARQASENANHSVVQLNGVYGLELGNASDVLNTAAASDRIEVVLKTSGGERCAYRFAVSDDPNVYNLAIDERAVSPVELTRTGVQFTFLTAERLGPRDQNEVSADEQRRIGLGLRGEFTAQVLAQFASERIESPMLCPPRDGEEPVLSLRGQVEAWASWIIRPVRIEALLPLGVRAATIRFREAGLDEDGLPGEPIRPTNMGFGFSYALPLIVAGLVMKPGGFLIVENPEAHLHPAGQSRIGAFLARVAGSGVQVLVETHSDHVVNGIRLAAAEDQVIAAQEVILHYFADPATELAEDERDEHSPSSGGSVPIGLTAKGGLTAWPIGFFDQLESDLGRLSRVRRG